MTVANSFSAAVVVLDKVASEPRGEVCLCVGVAATAVVIREEVEGW